MALFSKKKSTNAPRRRQTDTPTGDARRHASEQYEKTVNTTYKRNRTLTGSLSSRVSSASESQADLKSPRAHAHDLHKQRRRIGTTLIAVLVACLALGGILYQFTAYPVVNANDEAVALDKERYEKVVDAYLSRRPVERLRFVLDTQRLNDYIRQELPEVDSIAPDGAAGFAQGAFLVNVRKPIVSWLIGERQYFVDADGVPFEKNYYEIPAVKIIDQSGVQQTEGTAIASSRFLNFVGRAVSESQKYGLSVDEAIIPVATTRQIELRIKDHTYPIKLSLDRPVGEQVEDMQRAIMYLDGKNIKPQYIDVRVSGKAYYK